MTQKLYTHKYSDDPECRNQVASRASSKQNMIISFLEESIGQTKGPFFLESGLSTADIYLHMLTAWDPSVKEKVLSSSATSTIPSKERLINIEYSYCEMLKQPAISEIFILNGY